MRRNRQKVSKLRDNRLKLPRDQQTSMKPDQPVAAPSAITFSRRDFLKLMGCTIVNTPSAMQAIGQVGLQQRKQVIYLPNFAASVLRPEDLLVLCFEFFNLILKTREDKPARLVREKAGLPAYIAVHFPPQNIAEEAFFETAVNSDGTGFPVRVTPGAPEGAEDSDEGNDDQPVKLKPPGQVQSRISGTSRLVFRVPDSVNEIEYTLTALLQACQVFEQNVLPKAQPPGPPPSPFPSGSWDQLIPSDPARMPYQQRRALIQGLPYGVAISKGLIRVPDDLVQKAMAQVAYLTQEPKEPYTTIETPYRLILSPSIFAAWAYSLTPVTRNGRTELWHTRLGYRSEDGIEEQDDYYRTLRAISTPDYKEMDGLHQPGSYDRPPHYNPNDDDTKRDLPFRTSLDERDRYEIVKLTGDPQITGWRERFIQAERLILTSLGAWMNTRYAAEIPVDEGLSVEEWRHRATMGRDHYVRVVYKGFLFPFGHRASLIKITERKFHPETKGNIAYLRQRMYIVVRQPIKEYPAFGQPNEGRRIPFRTVRITTLVTPNLDDPTASQILNLGQSLFWPRVSNEDFLFHLVGEDWEGQRSEFTAPLIFVGNENAYDKFKISAIGMHYNLTPNKSRRERDLWGQNIAYAESKNHGDTTLETIKITFGWERPDDAITALQLEKNDQPRFYPTVAKAEVHIPSIKQLVDGPARIKFDNTYLSKGVDSNDNKGQVFVQVFKPDVDEPFPLIFGGNGKKNAAKAGGIITPNMAITGLSRLLGPVGGSLGSGEGENFVPGDVVKGKFDPVQFFSEALEEAKILGGIPLSGIIQTIDDFTTNLKKAPKIVSRTIKEGLFSPPTAIETTFKLQPDLKKYPPTDWVFEPLAGASLTINGWMRTDLATGDSRYQFNGELKKFKIILFPPVESLISLNFNSLAFTAKNGQKPNVSADIPEVKFEGKLSFLNKLQNYIPSGGFCGPKGIEVTEDGIVAGYSQKLPDIGFGVFSLKNIALAGKLNLPFTGEPAVVRFDFATRENPFLLSVAIFGGGGYFGMGVGLNGIHSLEASLNFGASISLNLGIASGGVEVIGGVIYEQVGDAVDFIAFLRMGGHLVVLGFFGVSVEFEINLNYESNPKRLYGSARLEVEVDFGLWSVEYGFTVERELAAGSPPPPTFADLMEHQDWEQYCLAFAAD